MVFDNRGCIEKKLAKMLDDIKSGDNATVGILVEGGDYNWALFNTMKNLQNREMKNGIYVSARHTTKIMKEMLQRASVSSDDLYFVDVVSVYLSLCGMDDAEKNTANKNFSYIEHPGNLIDILMIVEKLVKRHETGYFVIDSLTHLLLHNNANSIKDFSHRLINIMKEYRHTSVWIMTKRATPDDLIGYIGTMCDIFIDLTRLEPEHNKESEINKITL